MKRLFVIAGALTEDGDRPDRAVQMQEGMAYSIPRMLLGSVKSSPIPFSCISNAFARAAGKERPLRIPSRRVFLKLSEASASARTEAAFCSSPASPHSLPKQSESTTPSRSNRETAPPAKNSALAQAKRTGSSRTRSPRRQAPYAPGVFIQNGRHATLCKIAAHHYDDIIGSGKFFRFLYMISMSFVKGIIFCNNSGNLHVKSPFRIQF